MSGSPAISVNKDVPEGTSHQATNSSHQLPELVQQDVVSSQQATTDAAAEATDVGEASAVSVEPAQGPTQATNAETATTADTVIPDMSAVLDEQPTSGAADATAEAVEDTATEQAQPDAGEDQAVDAGIDMVQEQDQHSADDDKAAKPVDGVAADAQPDSTKEAGAQAMDVSETAVVATDQAQPSIGGEAQSG